MIVKPGIVYSDSNLSGFFLVLSVRGDRIEVSPLFWAAKIVRFVYQRRVFVARFRPTDERKIRPVGIKLRYKRELRRRMRLCVM